MGKKKVGSKDGYVNLTKKDNEEEIERQWGKVRSFASAPGKVLLSHHKNHYALVFACREYLVVGEGGGMFKHRECFTARKGQRPTEWIEFKELRDTYLSWEGYKLMLVEGKKVVV